MGPQDIAFLVYDLPAPLGKKDRYLDILKMIVDESEDNKEKPPSILAANQRFIIKPEKNMVLPAGTTLDELKFL